MERIGGSRGGGLRGSNLPSDDGGGGGGSCSPDVTDIVHGLAVNGITAGPHVLQVNVPPGSVLVTAHPGIRVIDSEEGVRLTDLNRSRELLVPPEEVSLAVRAASHEPRHRALAALARADAATRAESLWKNNVCQRIR